MTAPSPAGLSPLLDQLDEALAKGTPGPWRQDPAHPRYIEAPDQDDLAEALDPADAALIAAAVNALPHLTAAVRGALALADELETGTRPGLIGFAYDQMANRIRSALTAALTPGADTAGATA